VPQQGYGQLLAHCSRQQTDLQPRQRVLLRLLVPPVLLLLLHVTPAVKGLSVMQRPGRQRQVLAAEQHLLSSQAPVLLLQRGLLLLLLLVVMLCVAAVLALPVVGLSSEVPRLLCWHGVLAPACADCLAALRCSRC
jgi:hypothetical protein